MKKIVLLVMIAVGVWSCSTDNDEVLMHYESDVSERANEESAQALSATTTCFTDLSASVSVDVSNGIGNPTVVFTPAITGPVRISASYRVRVEVQPLSDCDDMNSNTGTLLAFGPSGSVQNVLASPPAISVLPANMPSCYKWRFVFESPAGTPKSQYCLSASIWYESPLF
ncbi:MAG: hypothetical protein DI539_18640 [Flavobacterium psychrophilum]|nr:MAG: hypothetical protein DI539_18640 [Flavobacterium psychrophilum]